jgi:rare lipoprotein A
MYVPATPAQPAATLAPIVITASTTPPLLGPVHTALSDLHSDLNVLADHRTTITGKLAATAGGAPGAHTAGAQPTGLAGQLVTLQALGDHGWRTLTRTRTGARGRFRLRFIPRQRTTERVRLRFAGDAENLGARRALGRLNVYRLVQASWYGGGGELACGGELTSATMGVANKTLPCGTKVTLRYGGRSVRVAVIDRGPYVAGREFDLTEATKQALGFGDVGEVWSTR